MNLLLTSGLDELGLVCRPGLGLACWKLLLMDYLIINQSSNQIIDQLNYLPIQPSSYLSIYNCIQPSLHASIPPSFHPSMHPPLNPSIRPAIIPSFYLCIYLYIFLSTMCLSTIHVSTIYLSFFLQIIQLIHQSISCSIN